MLEQGDDVGKGLVKGQHVRVGRLHEVLVEAVEQRMRGLVGHHVVRQAGEDHAAGELAGGSVLRGRKVTEQQGTLVPAVVRIGHAQGVRVDPEPLHELVRRWNAPVPFIPVGPEGLAAEGALEAVDGRHDHRVDHLLVELRVPLGGREAVLRQDGRPIQVHGCIEARAGRVVVHHLDVFADRTGRQQLPRHLVGDLAHEGGLELGGQAGVEGVAAQQATGGGRGLGREVGRGRWRWLPRLHIGPEFDHTRGLCLGRRSHRGHFASFVLTGPGSAAWRISQRGSRRCLHDATNRDHDSASGIASPAVRATSGTHECEDYSILILSCQSERAGRAGWAAERAGPPSELGPPSGLGRRASWAAERAGPPSGLAAQAEHGAPTRPATREGMPHRSGGSHDTID